MKSSTCPICQSVNTIEIYPSTIENNNISFTYEFSPNSQKTYRVVRCMDCSHVFCSPLPKNIYKNYVDVTDNIYLSQTKSRILSAKAVKKIIERYKPSGCVLDIGCATGDFLMVMKSKNYKIEGLELSRWASVKARKRGIKIHECTIEKLSKKNSEKYDIITLFGVIEHFEFPYKEMKYINKLLKPDGLLVLWTGDVDSLTSKLLRRKWWYWQGQHIQYFSHKSLLQLSKRTGFKHIKTIRYPIASTLEQMENSLSRYRFKNIFLALVKPLFLVKKIWYLHLPGEMLWIGKKEF